MNELRATGVLAKAAPPTAFPPPGSFGVSQMVTLLSATPEATIHFTLDGSVPTTASPVFDPFQLPVLQAVNDGDRGVTSTYRIRAIATAPGLAASEVASFDYTIERRSKDVYLATEVHPGVFQLRDFDDTKMMLIVGSQRAVLVDAGLGRGDLRGFVEARIGGRPLDVVITHGHPDHIAALAQFQGKYEVFMNHLDLPMVERFSEEMQLGIDLGSIIDLHEGKVFDLGDRRLEVYELPGHAPGHTVLFDAANRLLFASDAVGSNRPSITDSLWMQFPGMAPIDIYLSSLRVFRAKVAGRIGEIYGGHNDAVIYGEAYLDNLEQAAQLLVDEGEAVLVPSLRPTTAFQVVVGDRLTDPDWAAINVAKETCLSAPPARIATLSNLLVDGKPPALGFKPGITAYRAQASAGTASITATTTASRASLTINGAPCRSGTAQQVPLAPGDNVVTIECTAPDGVTKVAYAVMVAL